MPGSQSESDAMEQADEGRDPALNVVDRVAEMCFGLFMALTFVGAVSSATSAASPTSGADAGHTMLVTALGCNLAWGLVDAIMFLVRTLADRGMRFKVATAAREAPTATEAVRAIRTALSPSAQLLLSDAEIDMLRQRMANAVELPERAKLNARDLLGSIRIFFIVVLSTFPVALPFVLLSDVPTALIVSRILTLIMLFVGGMALGRHAGFNGWATGLGMTALGVVLTMAVIALGG
ncbi:cation transport ATPase [Cupriavidus metallidurans]|uniref:VIT family protein n=2 Tax=Burkholderiaceae TaxID=119060 RepID=Q1LB37_CUPMC|nr:membrane protein [Cupriavidus metallidurans]ABF12639.1 hypothetical protein Rmet_5780 [Cupriavidus metallidurans CH34]MDE4921091.1 hypothetical protein [Cupriavidus metallidurans]